MKKGKLILFSIIEILLMSSIYMVYSYSLWSATHTQDTSNAVNTGCFEVTFSESGSNINLTNTYPISDAKGLLTTPYTFTITNTCSIASSASIMINPQTGTTLDLKYIRAAIKEANDPSYSVKTLTDYTSGTIASGDTSSLSSYIVASTYLLPNASKTYSILMWLDESAGNDTQGKILNASVKVSEAASNTYADSTGASIPELYQGLIPVTYDTEGNVVVADTSQEWFDYAKHNWANAVLVNCADETIKNKYFDSSMNVLTSMIGQTISMDEILEMYVWIPRYKYLLWNAENGSSDPQAITIVFEDKSTPKSAGSTNGTYLTHPAFTFGNTELNGIWVGKFETSGTTDSLTIKPNMYSLTGINLGTMFNASRNQELTYSNNYGITSNEIDTHMMKNMEWGAVAYLSSSIYGRYNDSTTCISTGCEVWINNVNTGYGDGTAVDGVSQYGPSITGCSGSSVSAEHVDSMTACSTGYDWTALGVNASTTGSLYGIYDMSGGLFEYVMGNEANSDGSYYDPYSVLQDPGNKYYDSYSKNSNEMNFMVGKLGDATKEIITRNDGYSAAGWNSAMSRFPFSTNAWFIRGGLYKLITYPSIFANGSSNGKQVSNVSFRAVLTAE